MFLNEVKLRTVGGSEPVCSCPDASEQVYHSGPSTVEADRIHSQTLFACENYCSPLHEYTLLSSVFGFVVSLSS